MCIPQKWLKNLRWYVKILMQFIVLLIKQSTWDNLCYRMFSLFQHFCPLWGCIRKLSGHLGVEGGGGWAAHPLHPPPRSALMYLLYMGVKDKHSYIFYFINFFYNFFFEKCNVIGHVVLFFFGGSAPWDWNSKTPTKQQKWPIF